MRRILIVLIALLALTGAEGYAQEVFNSTNPVVGCTQSSFTLKEFHVEDTGTNQFRVLAEVRDNCGVSIRDEHTTSTPVTGNTVLSALNAPGNYTNSLFKRILLHLQSEGKIPAGTVTGTPQ